MLDFGYWFLGSCRQTTILAAQRTTAARPTHNA